MKLLLDTTVEEARLETTVSIKVRPLLVSDAKTAFLVDAPGTSKYKDYFRSMCLADVAVLVVPFSPAADHDCLTHESVLAAKCFGVRHFVVALSKADQVSAELREAQYLETAARVDALFAGVFGEDDWQAEFVPVSALQGWNLRPAGPGLPGMDLGWWAGRSLWEAITTAERPFVPLDQTLRVYLVGGAISEGSTTLQFGKVVSGFMRPDEKLIRASCQNNPGALQVEITVHRSDSTIARISCRSCLLNPGTIFRSMTTYHHRFVRDGDFAVRREEETPLLTTTGGFLARVTVVRPKAKIGIGFNLMFACNSIRLGCRVTDFLEINGFQPKRFASPEPKTSLRLLHGDSGLVELEPVAPGAHSRLHLFPAVGDVLGRCVLLDGHHIVAAGSVAAAVQ